ncbi:hypothetical protein KY366_06105 [Candidatus Woesearchaeota archaeon]|nr:hypothetical protein [Candidatus Woesearchaeota archaeon]
MAEEGTYEIMPYKEIINLEKRLAELEQKKGGPSSKELLSSMSSLTKSMNNMLQLFSSAAEEMKIEEKEEHALTIKLDPLTKKIENLESQNKTIAEGLVAIADMVQELKEEKPKRYPGKEKSKAPPRPADHGFPPPLNDDDFPPLDKPDFPPLEPPRPTQPPFHGSPRIVTKRPMPPPGMPPRGPMPPPPKMPPPGMPPPLAPPDFPFPPLEEEHSKKGLFGMFKKK